MDKKEIDLIFNIAVKHDLEQLFDQYENVNPDFKSEVYNLFNKFKNELTKLN